jgi:hypothetical protein
MPINRLFEIALVLHSEGSLTLGRLELVTWPSTLPLTLQVSTSLVATT